MTRRRCITFRANEKKEFEKWHKIFKNQHRYTNITRTKIVDKTGKTVGWELCGE